MKNKGDAVVALLVIACSAVLLLALYFAIGGNPFSKPHLTLTVDVEDGILTMTLRVIVLTRDEKSTSDLR